jgi:hypothetical protein
MNDLELEIAREQAEALGLAGKKLQESIDAFNRAARQAETSVDHDRLLGDIASRAWALMVQRELMGFTHENLRWVLDRFDVPDGALRKMGQQEGA